MLYDKERVAELRRRQRRRQRHRHTNTPTNRHRRHRHRHRHTDTDTDRAKEQSRAQRERERERERERHLCTSEFKVAVVDAVLLMAPWPHDQRAVLHCAVVQHHCSRDALRRVVLTARSLRVSLTGVFTDSGNDTKRRMHFDLGDVVRVVVVLPPVRVWAHVQAKLF